MGWIAWLGLGRACRDFAFVFPAIDIGGTWVARVMVVLVELVQLSWVVGSFPRFCLFVRIWVGLFSWHHSDHSATPLLLLRFSPLFAALLPRPFD